MKIFDFFTPRKNKIIAELNRKLTKVEGKYRSVSEALRKSEAERSDALLKVKVAETAKADAVEKLGAVRAELTQVKRHEAQLEKVRLDLLREYNELKAKYDALKVNGSEREKNGRFAKKK